MRRTLKLLKGIKPEIIEVTLENVKNIKYKNIVAFTYAHPGAMGDCGQLTAIQIEDKPKFYHTNRFYEDDTITKIVDSTYFKPFADILNTTGFFAEKVDGWDIIDMGYGNCIIIRNEYEKTFKKLVASIDFNFLNYRVPLYQNHIALLYLFFDKKYENTVKELLVRTPSLLGGIIGDIVGSRFEFNPIKSKDFDLFYSFSGVPYSENQTMEDHFKSSHFTDDTVMTIAIANALLQSNWNYDNLRELAIKNMKDFGNRYPYRGYGLRFNTWLNSNNSQPYNSYGNGSAMRIGAVPYFAHTLNEVKELSKIVTEVTHNHPEGIKGAEAVAICIWMALHNYPKEEIKQEIEENFYKLDFDYQDLVKNYKFDETCQNSVPQSIYAFLISNSYEDAIRIAISMGGDADTMACIAGSIAGAYYGIPNEIKEEAIKYLPEEFKVILNKFENRVSNIHSGQEAT